MSAGQFPKLGIVYYSPRVKNIEFLFLYKQISVHALSLLLSSHSTDYYIPS